MKVNTEWLTLLQALMGPYLVNEVMPRGMASRELLAYQSQVDMSDPRLAIDVRKIGRRFMFAEAAWILSGDNRVSTISPFSKEISRFSDDGHRYFGAYGPKVVDQLSYCAQKLLADPDTRQAVISIWRENPGLTKDVPCTLSLQFIRRPFGTLNCIATMRSSDAWLGWPYDVFNFSMIAWALCIYVRKLDGTMLTPGQLYLTAGSQHIYEKHYSAAREVINRGKEVSNAFSLENPTAYGTVDEFVQFLWASANATER